MKDNKVTRGKKQWPLNSLPGALKIPSVVYFSDCCNKNRWYLNNLDKSCAQLFLWSFVVCYDIFQSTYGFMKQPSKGLCWIFWRAFIQTVGEKSFFGPLTPSHCNTEIMVLFSRPCHKWAVGPAPVPVFHLTMAIRDPLWLITACPMFD